MKIEAQAVGSGRVIIHALSEGVRAVTSISGDFEPQHRGRQDCGRLEDAFEQGARSEGPGL